MNIPCKPPSRRENHFQRTNLEEFGVPNLLNPEGTQQTLYFVDSRITSEELLRHLILKRAQLLVAKKDSKMVDRSTQTY